MVEHLIVAQIVRVRFPFLTPGRIVLMGARSTCNAVVRVRISLCPPCRCSSKAERLFCKERVAGASPGLRLQSILALVALI